MFMCMHANVGVYVGAGGVSVYVVLEIDIHEDVQRPGQLWPCYLLQPGVPEADSAPDLSSLCQGRR